MTNWFRFKSDEGNERTKDWHSKTSDLLEKMNDAYEKAFDERPFKMYMEIPEYYYYLVKYDEYRMSK